MPKRKSTSPYARAQRTRALPVQVEQPAVQEQVPPPVVQEQVAPAPPVVVPAQVEQPNPPPPLVPDVQLVRPDGDQARPVGQVDLAIAAPPPMDLQQAILMPGGEPVRPVAPLDMGMIHEHEPILSVSSQLGVGVSSAIKTKIINGEYVDLGTLAPRRTSTSTCSTRVSIVQGELVILPNINPVAIVGIEQWTDLFIVYMSLYTATHPEATTGLLKYMHNVRLGEKRASGLAWKTYDEEFRLKKVRDPLMEWGKIDQELWLLYIYPQSLVLSQDLSNQKGPRRFLKCYDYDNFGWCSKLACDYLHKCMGCSGPHPSVKCQGFTSRTMAGRQNFRPIRPQRFGGPTSTRGASQPVRYSGHRTFPNRY